MLMPLRLCQPTCESDTATCFKIGNRRYGGPSLPGHGKTPLKIGARRPRLAFGAHLMLFSSPLPKTSGNWFGSNLRSSNSHLCETGLEK